MTKQQWFIGGALMVGLVIGFVAGFQWSGRVLQSTSNNSLATDGVGTTSSSGWHLVATDQAPGDKVIVTDVTVPSTTWITVQEDNQGGLGKILGARRIDEGSYPSLEIPLLRGTIVDRPYHLAFYIDDGDNLFDYKKDTLVKQGQAALVISFKTISDGSRGEQS